MTFTLRKPEREEKKPQERTWGSISIKNTFKAKLQAYCEREGVSMNDLLEQCVEYCVGEEING